ncbi:MAG TPA: MbnP family protein [Chitinophagaceae bacterium]|jgi:hypothetical protein
MKKLLFSFIIIAASLLSVGAGLKEYRGGDPRPGNFNLVLLFKPVVDSLPLLLDSVTYTNAWKETYSVNAFKFYVSGFRLIDTASGMEQPVNAGACFLIDVSDSATWTAKLPVPAGHRYNCISFTIGVDSARNVGGAQTGALDPVNGMFWTWNSGYVMAKLQGQSAVSSLVNNKMEYHIGGFRGETSVLRQVVLRFSQFLQTAPGGTSTVTIAANANAWFDGPHPITIAANPSCTTPGQMAKDISENYSRMFTIIQTTH